jgi:hypothetical protein
MRPLPATLLACGTLLAVAVGDYVTAWDFLFDFFYLVPITIAAIVFGKRGGLLMALAATVAWMVAFASQPYGLAATNVTRTILVWTWDFAVRFSVQASFAWLVSRLWDEAARQRQLLAELRAALDDVKRLRDLLPICAWCKKIRDDTGYWRQLEGYMHDHDIATFTHSICPECATKVREKP